MPEDCAPTAIPCQFFAQWRSQPQSETSEGIIIYGPNQDRLIAVRSAHSQNTTAALSSAKVG